MRPRVLIIAVTILATLLCALPASAQSAGLAGLPPSNVDTLTIWSDTGFVAGQRRDQVKPIDLKVVRREVRYREHVALAIFSMLFITLAMTASQSFNPD